MGNLISHKKKKEHVIQAPTPAHADELQVSELQPPVPDAGPCKEPYESSIYTDASSDIGSTETYSTTTSSHI